MFANPFIGLLIWTFWRKFTTCLVCLRQTWILHKFLTEQIILINLLIHLIIVFSLCHSIVTFFYHWNTVIHFIFKDYSIRILYEQRFIFVHSFNTLKKLLNWYTLFVKYKKITKISVGNKSTSFSLELFGHSFLRLNFRLYWCIV